MRTTVTRTLAVVVALFALGNASADAQRERWTACVEASSKTDASLAACDATYGRHSVRP